MAHSPEGAPASSPTATPPGERLRAGVISLPGVLMQSVTSIAPAIAGLFTVPFIVLNADDRLNPPFLARLCLASGDNPLWKFETSAPVDTALSDETERARWRQSWRDTLASLGVAEAADPGGPPSEATQTAGGSRCR